jgi:hypothetical protein
LVPDHVGSLGLPSRLHRHARGDVRLGDVVPVTDATLRAETGRRHAGGTVTHRVYLAGRWVGWVGDGREWLGHDYGPRRWWAAHREEGDTAARANSGLVHGSRTAALAWLTERAAR